MPFGIGLAGLGIHGARYARHLIRGDVPGARLVAVCRRDETAGRSFADEHGIHYVREVGELAARPEVDGVVLVLPPDLHGPAALTVLGEGKPLLVEKPLAATRAAALEVVTQLERTAGWLMVGHTLRFDDVVRRLRDQVADLGALRLVAISQRFEPATRGWLDEPGPGGILLNTGVHGFDLLRYLTGLEASSVGAVCSRSTTRRTDDGFAGTLSLDPGNVLATLDNVRATDSRSGRIEIVGEHGQLWGDHVHRTLVRVRGKETTDLGPVPANATIPATLAAFVRGVRDAAEPAIAAADGLAAVELVEAAELAAREGRRVELDEIRS